MFHQIPAGARTMSSGTAILRLLSMAILVSLTTGTKAAVPQGDDSGLDFIDTSFENASPVWYERAPDGTVQVHLLYDHERSSPNRAAGHIHLRLHGRTGAKLTLEFMN